MAVVSSFDGWYRAIHPRVIGVVFVACGDPDLAADATDEAFARALLRWPAVQEMQSPTGWVCRVALNVMRRRLRRRMLEARLLAARRPVPAVVEPQVHTELWAAVRRLPERRRLAILLRYVGDLTESDVAEVMGISRGAVSAALSAARADLARMLENPASLSSDLEAPHG